MYKINIPSRYLREAAEAGRRQKEIRRRKEHDEMFKQIVKVTQESVDVYLHDVITEGVDFASREEATEYVLKLSKKIEEETAEAYTQKDSLSLDEQDEMIADMVLHFLVPEVEKKTIRDRLAARQKQNLKQIHDTIYSRFESLHKIKELKRQFEFESQENEETEPSTGTYISMELKEVTDKDSQGELDKKHSQAERYDWQAYPEDDTPVETERSEELIHKEDYELYLAGLDEATEEIEQTYDENVDEYTFNLLNETLDTITEVSEKSSQKMA